MSKRPLKKLGLQKKSWKFLSDPTGYWKESVDLDVEILKRQFRTCRDILQRFKDRKGVLLADDTGLGKTAVASIVALVVAAAGKAGRNVRILAPNQVVKRRWRAELEKHQRILAKWERSKHLEIEAVKVKERDLHKLLRERIHLTTHQHAAKGNTLVCDLLIVDEAHRARGEATAFSAGLKKRAKGAKRILFLTATPFSVGITELTRMLELIDAGHVRAQVGKSVKCLIKIFGGGPPQSVDELPAELAETLGKTVESLRPYVIRHAIETLPEAQKLRFGHIDERMGQIEVEPADERTRECYLRMDRALRLELKEGPRRSAAIDSRFYVGWQQFSKELQRLTRQRSGQGGRNGEIIWHHAQEIQKHLSAIEKLKKPHPKLERVAAFVEEHLNSPKNGKIVIFCVHHETADEVARYLHGRLDEMSSREVPMSGSEWKRHWEDLLKMEGGEAEQFRRWLALPDVRDQAARWLSPDLMPDLKQDERLEYKKHLDKTKFLGGETFRSEANRLLNELSESQSSKALLKRCKLLELSSRVLGIYDSSCNDRPYVWAHEPDAAISVFNSPFGPEVLVATDRLSEGIDLHRYCSTVIHYELHPSPLRVIQRNGRVRRPDCWSARTGQPIKYLYPFFPETRDQRLVDIVRGRVGQFSLLLGGVPQVEIETIENGLWNPSEIISKAKRDPRFPRPDALASPKRTPALSRRLNA